ALSADEAERRAYRARKRAERSIASYIVSLSFRTVTYKALCAADQLRAFYADLDDPRHEIPFGIFHQRFSTNTVPSWERAQPFRLICHNGEINAIQGNVNWMRAREGRLGSGEDALLAPVIDPSGSDSAMLDNALELLVQGGRDVRHALAMLIPEAWGASVGLEPAVRDFYRYHAGLCEPWDGPAAVVFTDGRVVGATLDRNGLRPLRYAVGRDLVVCASEAGVVDLPAGAVRRLARAGARAAGDRRPRPRATGGPDPAPGGVRLHAGGPAHPATADGCARARADVVDGRRLRAAAARRASKAALLVLPAALRPGHEPADRPSARALRLLPAHAARRSLADPARRPRGRRRARAGQLLPLPERARGARRRAPRRDVRPVGGAARRSRAARRPVRVGGAGRPWHAAPVGCGGRPGAGADPHAARRRRGARAARRAGAPDAGDDRRGERRAARGAPRRLSARLRCGGDLPAPRAAVRGGAGGAGQARRRPPLARGGAGALPAGDRGRRPQGHVEDGYLRRGQLLRRAAVRRDRARRRGGRDVLRGHRLGRRGLRLRRDRAGRAGAPRTRLGRRRPPGEPRLRQVPQGRRAACDQSGRRRGAARGRGRARAAHGGAGRGLGALRAVRLARQRTRADGAPRPARARTRRAAGAAGRGRAGRVDRPALLERRHVPRRPVGRGARDRGDRVQPAAGAGELRRGRRGSGALPRRAQLPYQAGRLRPF